MDLSMVVILLIFIVLVMYFLSSYKPMRVEINEYMISLPNRKIHYKWNEIEKISDYYPPNNVSNSVLLPKTLNMSKGFENNIRYTVTPKKGKKIMFTLSQVRTPHPTLKIHSIPKLIERKKEEYGI
jgi:hypothetical protein